VQLALNGGIPGRASAQIVLAIYAGIPAAVDAMRMAGEVLNSHKSVATV
jgi:alkylhydroperoxidase/carboxymuconolactone decarboxylase family protein YurZ